MRRCPRNPLDPDLLRPIVLRLGLGVMLGAGGPSGPLMAQPLPTAASPAPPAAGAELGALPEAMPLAAAPSNQTSQPRGRIDFLTDGLEAAPQASAISFGSSPPADFAPATIGPAPPLGAASDLFGNLPRADGSAGDSGISFGAAPAPSKTPEDSQNLASAASPAPPSLGKWIAVEVRAKAAVAPASEILRLAASPPLRLRQLGIRAELVPHPIGFARFTPMPVPEALRLRGKEQDPNQRPACQILNAVDPASYPACPPEGEELAGLLQTELRRLGCYSGEIDGDWGGRSRAAVARLAKESDSPAPEPEPSLALLNWLRAAPEDSCEPVLAVLPAPPPAANPPPRPNTPKPPVQKPAANREQKPAPAPRPSAQTTPAPQTPASSDSNRARTRRIIN